MSAESAMGRRDRPPLETALSADIERRGWGRGGRWAGGGPEGRGPRRGSVPTHLCPSTNLFDHHHFDHLRQIQEVSLSVPTHLCPSTNLFDHHHFDHLRQIQEVSLSVPTHLCPSTNLFDHHHFDHLRQIQETEEEGGAESASGGERSMASSSRPPEPTGTQPFDGAFRPGPELRGGLSLQDLSCLRHTSLSSAPMSLDERSGSEGVLFSIGEAQLSPAHSHSAASRLSQRRGRSTQPASDSDEEVAHSASAPNMRRALRKSRKGGRQEERTRLSVPRDPSPLHRQRLDSTDSARTQILTIPDRLRHRQLFVQLDELYIPQTSRGEMEWRETGRWIKYEEAVEVGAERWGKPHVSSLSFHSLLELLHHLRQGYVDLQLTCSDWKSVAEAIARGLHETGQISADSQALVSRALFLPHRHVGGQSSRGQSLGPRTATYNSLHHYFYRHQSLVDPNSSNLDVSGRHNGGLSGSRSSFGQRPSVSPKTPDEHFVPNGVPVASRSNLVLRKLSQVPVPTSVAQTTSQPPQGVPTIAVVAGNGHLDTGLAGGPGGDAQGQTVVADATPSPREENEGLLLHPPTRPRRASTASWLGQRLLHTGRHLSSPNAVVMEAGGANAASAAQLYGLSHETAALLKVLPRDAEAALMLVGSVDFVERPALALVRLSRPFVVPGRPTELPLPLRFVFLLLGPLNAGVDYHEVGRSMATLLSHRHFREAAYGAAGVEDLIRGVNDFCDDSIVLPPCRGEDRDLLPLDQIKTTSNIIRKRRTALTKKPSELSLLREPVSRGSSSSPSQSPGPRDEWLGDGALERTGRLFGGVRRELAQRLPAYLSDFTDAANPKCLFALLFIFFSCFFLALTFGAILNDKTRGAIGVKETLVATAGGGTLFALVSAQPVMLLGVSGPMLIFEESLFKLAGFMDAEFLALRVWVSWWALLATAVTVAFEGSFLIRFVSRFSDDILCTLLSVIFISESLFFLHATFQRHPILPLPTYCNASQPPLNGTAPEGETETSHPNVALLSLVFVAGTFALAVYFNAIRQSRFFASNVRRAVGDFGLSLAIILMVGLDHLLIGELAPTQKVLVSEGVEPQLEDGRYRAWLVSPLGRPWAMAVAALPGLLLFLVVFLETEVVEVELGRRENGLRKGTGFHWDLLLNGAMLVAAGHLGLPWLCGVPVRSMAHLYSLTEYKMGAPGQKPRVGGVVEQRVTGLVLHVLIGLTLLVPSLLRAVPVPVLFGVFLYIGVHNLRGVQMLGRALLFFVPLKYHPGTLYCKRVDRWRMHLFTGVQLAVFAAVCLVKSFKAVSFTFPLAVALTVLFRHFVLPRLFTPVELIALDGPDDTDLGILARLPI